MPVLAVLRSVTDSHFPENTVQTPFERRTEQHPLTTGRAGIRECAAPDPLSQPYCLQSLFASLLPRVVELSIKHTPSCCRADPRGLLTCTRLGTAACSGVYWCGQA